VADDWPALFARPASTPRSIAAGIAACFAAIGVAWMVVTHVLVYGFFRDDGLLARIDSASDWSFLIFASAVLYVVAHRASSRIAHTRSVLSAVVASIGDGLLVVGPERKIVYANPAALQMLGCESESELVGISAKQFSRRFLVTDPNGALIAPDALSSQRAFVEDHPIHYKAILHPTPEGELVFLSTAAAVRAHHGDKPALVVSVLHDVTDTENLERMRDRFFNATAHALKTPVAIIKANVQFIARSSRDPAPSSMRAIERQCDRIDRLVQNLQVTARARSHSLELHLREMELAPLLLRTVREINTRGNLDVHTEVAAEPLVYGDGERLAIAMRNLTYEAVMSAKLRTPIEVRLTAKAGEAELGVYFDPLPVAERTFAGSEEYDDNTLSRFATTTIVTAHGGQLGEDITDHRSKLWVRLPTMEEAHGVSAERRADRR
jgi:signal transduction histidine kinase